MAENKRQTELDILRLLATLAVIMIHGGLNPLTDNLMIKYMYRGMHAAIVWCVPVFFMISGRFFLDPERDVSTKKPPKTQKSRRPLHPEMQKSSALTSGFGLGRGRSSFPCHAV